MRELTKSMMSFTWAVSLFSLDRAAGLFNPRPGAEAGSYDRVTRAMREQLGGLTGPAFRAGDNMQRAMVDMMFGVMPGSGDCAGCGGGGARAGAGGGRAAAGGMGASGASGAMGAIGGMGASASQAASAATSAASSAMAGAGAAGSQLIGLGIEVLQQGINVFSRLSGLGTPQGQSGWGPVPPPPQA